MRQTANITRIHNELSRCVDNNRSNEETYFDTVTSSERKFTGFNAFRIRVTLAYKRSLLTERVIALPNTELNRIKCLVKSTNYEGPHHAAFS
jgi:hypothetical protein